MPLKKKVPAKPRARFEVYQTVTTGEWRWRLLARNGRILASGEGFDSRANAVRAVSVIKRAVADTIDTKVVIL